MTLEIHQVPVISTEHLDPYVAKELGLRGDNNPWVSCAVWEYGYFIYVDDLDLEDEEIPQCLRDLSKWYSTLPEYSGWLLLDSSADLVEGLPSYDW